MIPVYDEEEVLPQLLAELESVLDEIDLDWEVVFVDDGSRDRSREILIEAQQRNRRMTVVELSRNWGHQAAITAGLEVSRGDAVVLMDADLQDPPEVIAKMVDAWRDGAQVVHAQRRNRKETGVRLLLFRLFYWLLGLVSDYPIPLNAGIFGLLDRAAVDALLCLHESNRYLPGLRAWIGFRTTFVTYDRASRAAGTPKQNLWRLLKYGLDAIFSFSFKPLRLSLVVGTATALFAIVYGIVLFVHRLLGKGMFGIPVVDGYTSTIVAILFLGGIQLLGIGILGEYLGRVYDEVKRRPLYFIQAIHSDRAEERHQCAESLETPAPPSA